MNDPFHNSCYYQISHIVNKLNKDSKRISFVIVENEVLKKIMKQKIYWGSSIWYVRKIFPKTNISYPLISTSTGGKKCYFFGKFCVHTKWMTPWPVKWFKRKNNLGFDVAMKSIAKLWLNWPCMRSVWSLFFLIRYFTRYFIGEKRQHFTKVTKCLAN